MVGFFLPVPLSKDNWASERQFDLEDEEPRAFEFDWDVPQFCDEWQEIKVGGGEDKSQIGKLVKVAARTTNTLFVVDTNI